MINAKPHILTAILLLIACGCSSQSLKNATIRYKTHREYPSLEIIYKLLGGGMKPSDVESLLAGTHW